MRRRAGFARGWMTLVALVLGGLAGRARAGPPPAPPPAERWAVVIGVARYDDPGIPAVPNASTDAEAVRDWMLTAGGFTPDHLLLLLDQGSETVQAAAVGAPIAATRSNLVEVFGDWLPSRATADDEIVVFFAGQGATGSAPTALLLPRDARAKALDETGYAAASVARAVAATGPGAALLWLDTSFRGRGSATSAPVRGWDLDELALGEHGEVWIAAAPTEVAAERAGAPYGAFTYALLSGLRATDGRIGATWDRARREVQGGPEPIRIGDFVDELRIARAPSGAIVRPKLVLQSGHGSSITALAADPSGRWLATADEAGTVNVWDMASRDAAARFVGAVDAVEDLTFSGDGGTLFVAGQDGSVRAFSMEDGRLTWSRRIDTGVQDLSLAEGELAAAVFDKVVFLDEATGRRLGSFHAGADREEWIAGHVWVAGEDLVTASDAGVVARWRVADGGAFRRVRSRFAFGERLGWDFPEFLSLAVVDQGSRVVTGDANGITRLWNVDLGSIERYLPSNGYKVTALASNAAGAEVAVAAHDIRIWPWQSPEPRVVIPTPVAPSSLVFGPDGSWLASGHADGVVRVWSTEDGSPRFELPGTRSLVYAVTVSEERALLGVAGEAGAWVWDLAQGRLAAALEGHTGDVNGIQFLRGRDEVVTASTDGTVRWWGLPDGDLRETRETEAGSAWSLASVGDRLVTATAKGVVQVWSAADHSRLGQWAARVGREPAIWEVAACGAEGQLYVLQDGRLARADLASGALLPGPTRRARTIACSSDRSLLAVGTGSGRVKVFDAADLRHPVRMARGSSLLADPYFWRDPFGAAFGSSRAVEALAFHPSRPELYAVSEESPLRWWDAASGRAAGRGAGPTMAESVAIYEAGGLVITGSRSGLIELWDLTTGQLVATAAAVGTDWVVATPEGLFDGSPAGQAELFRWRFGGALVTPDRFRGYHLPGLLAELARGNRPKPSQDLATRQPPPVVRFLEPAPNLRVTEPEIVVRFSVRDQGGGVSEPRLYQNGHRVDGRRGLDRGGGADGAVFEFRVDLADGVNHLRATAFNGDTSWESLGAELSVTWVAPPLEAPVLHVVAVGIDNYRNTALRLGFAADDAHAIGEFFQPGLYSKVRVHEVLDEDASLAGIREVLERVRVEAQPRDAVVLYLGGHGVVQGELFYFLPWDVDVASEDTIRATALSQVELGDAMTRIAATKQLLVLDACHSGAAAGSLGQMLARRAGPELVRAQNDLARRAGAFLIAASTDAQYAHEVPELGHGVLTYALLQGLEHAPSGADTSDLVTVNQIIDYVSVNVPRLTAQYHNARQEVVHAATGQTFALAVRK